MPKKRHDYKLIYKPAPNIPSDPYWFQIHSDPNADPLGYQKVMNDYYYISPDSFVGDIDKLSHHPNRKKYIKR